MASMMRGAIQGGVGQGLEKAAGNIMNAYFMKKKLEVNQQVADAQKVKAQADVRRSDAYTQYLNSRDIMRQFTDGHKFVRQYMQSLQAKPEENGPGSTANQLATMYAGAPATAAPEALAGTSTSPDTVPAVRGMAMPQMNPAPDRSAARQPAVQSPAMTPPPPPPSDPRTLLGPQRDFDLPMFGDHDAT